MDKPALISMLSTRDKVEKARIMKEELERIQKEEEEKGNTREGGRQRIPCSLATMFARKEDIDDATHEDRPPDERPTMPSCYASDIEIPKTYRGVRESKYGDLWADAVQREFYGLFDAGTFEPV